MDFTRHAPLGRLRPRFASASVRSRPHAYAGRSGALLPEIYATDHADGRRGGRFRWVLSTCLAAGVGALAILVSIAGSLDSRDTDFASLDQRQASLALRLPATNPEGLRWALPKTDKMLIPSGVSAQKFYIPEPVKQRRGNREYTPNRYYVRLVARPGPITKKQALTVPPFEPFKLYNNAAPIEGSDRSEGLQEAVARTLLKELNGILPNEDGQELDTQEVIALVSRAQATEDD